MTGNMQHRHAASRASICADMGGRIRRSLGRKEVASLGGWVYTWR